MWARKYQHCIDCKKTDRNHKGRGLCNRCFGRINGHKDWLRRKELMAANPEMKARYNARQLKWVKEHRPYYNQLKIQQYKKSAQFRFTRKVHHMVAIAIKDGILKRSMQCEQCPNIKQIEAHHDDYTKPLEVRWLCRQCHAKIHKT